MNLTRRGFIGANLALVLAPAATLDSWQGVGRIVAVGDVHGDKDALSAVLKMSGLVDEKEHWIGGAAHLVQVGDVPARGIQTRQAFDMLIRLEKEAAVAGGKVHALIGNHEAGVMSGDLRNILPGEYSEFAGPDSVRKLERAHAAEATAQTAPGKPELSADELERRMGEWRERHPPGFVEHREAFSPSGYYGSWIRGNNAVIRINDTLFLHGGISPKFVSRTRASMNGKIQEELSDPERLLPGTATDVQGPLWYRGLAEGEEPMLERHLAAVLEFHGVRRIVIGHTVTRSCIRPRFGSRVVNVDIGLSRFYGLPPACLVIEAASAYVMHRNVTIPLPGRGQGELLKYLETVAQADERPSPVRKLIADLALRP